MSQSFQVATAELSGLASSIASLTDELRSALDAGQVTVPANAYGQTCQQLATMLNAVARAGATTLQTGIDQLESVSTNLRTNANAYAAAEAQGSAAFTGIGGQLT